MCGERQLMPQSQLYTGASESGVDGLPELWECRCASGPQSPLRALAVGAVDGDLATCGIVRCEVGRGIRRAEVWATFFHYWEVMLNVSTDARLWREVEAVAWQLDRKGIILPLPDLIIGCCALRIGAAVLSFDSHFEMIPGLRVIDRLD